MGGAGLSSEQQHGEITVICLKAAELIKLNSSVFLFTASHINCIKLGKPVLLVYLKLRKCVVQSLQRSNYKETKFFCKLEM